MSAKRKRKKTLGEAATEFVQGGNQAQTFILIVLVFIIVFYLVSNLPKIFDAFFKKDDPKPNVTPDTPDIPIEPKKDSNDVAPIPSSTIEQVKIIQRLLKSLGYDLGNFGFNRDGIDGDAGGYYSKTNTALRSFSASTGKGQFGATTYPDWIRILRQHTGQTGLAGLSSNPIKRKIVLLS